MIYLNVTFRLTSFGHLAVEDWHDPFLEDVHLGEETGRALVEAPDGKTGHSEQVPLAFHLGHQGTTFVTLRWKKQAEKGRGRK